MNIEDARLGLPVQFEEDVDDGFEAVFVIAEIRPCGLLRLYHVGSGFPTPLVDVSNVKRARPPA